MRLTPLYTLLTQLMLPYTGDDAVNNSLRCSRESTYQASTTLIHSDTFRLGLSM